MKTVCRVCFTGFPNEDCFPLSSPSGLVALKTIEKVFKNVIPEVNISLIKDSSICVTCWETLSQFYKLKVNCLANEQNFYQFLVKNDWQGTVKDFVFSTEAALDANDVKAEIEIVFEETPATELVTEDPNFLLSYQECTVDDDNKGEETIPLVDPNEDKSMVKYTNEELEEDKILLCSLCLIECKNYAEALSHVTSAHGIHGVFCCKYCSEFFIDPQSLEAHLLKTHVKEFPCTICGANFLSRHSLYKHLNTHPEYAELKNQKEFKCAYCNLVFERKRRYTVHIRTHQRSLFTCEICGKSHGSNSLLQEHRLIHSNIKRYMCEKCGKCFKQKSILWFHNHKYHLNIKKKQCPYCPKTFFREYDLKSHQTVHTGEKNYPCHVCLKAFTTPANVRRHMAIHTGEKHHCNICGRSYAQKQDLKRHTCPSGVPYKRPSGDKMRLQQAPSEKARVNCEICNKVLSKDYINLHMRIHTGEKPELCNVCGKAFATVQGLARHILIHTGEKRFKCEECDCSFIQKVQYEAHMRRRHTGEKPYECKVCDKRFVEISILLRHNKSRVHQLAVDLKNRRVSS